ncbi:hypothetical protein diail_1177 [Diaporthe ilicicola]|nr:hypothetical protein diail_1177 [Diaporthe ilicicola]
MASEEPRSLRDTSQAADARPGSAPAATLAATTSGIPRANLNPTIYGTSATQGSTVTADPVNPSNGQQPNTSTQAKERLVDATEQSGENGPDMAGAKAAQDPTRFKVKTEPEAGASLPHPTSDVSSNVVDQQHGCSVGEEHGALDPASSDLPPQEKDITLDNVRKAADTTDLVKLEAGAEAACQILDLLRQPMVDSKQTEQLDWLNRIDKLISKTPRRNRTVVAVAGATGAGKSSLINALLDEEKLLPTSSYRACTAVITEISYNESEDPLKAYRAEVEFIDQDNWESELKLLYGDLIEGKQLSPAYMDANTEAGVAYAKIRAVYPDLTHDMIARSDAQHLAKRDAVADVLGQTRRIVCSNARNLYKSLRIYLDSKDKDTEYGPRREEDMAFWPLIKVVKIFTRASVLKTGLCVVDLPGSQDCNSARCAVASKYMTECSAVWVAAPIKRAVDDEAARKLLGIGSRLQMRLDGIYSHVTFICTMTDSVQLSEIEEDFDGDGEIQATHTRGDDLVDIIRTQEDSIEKLRKQLSEGTTAYQGLQEECRAWKSLQRKQKKGQQVFPPRVPAKRKHDTRTGPMTRSRSCRQIVVDDSDSDDAADRNPLTAEEISSKLADIEGKLESKDADCEEMEKRLEIMQNELIALEDEKKDTAVDTARLCIQKRNFHVKKAIQVDFANGMRETDEADAQADDRHFDPSVKHRDYDEIGRSLPVFCVSSKAYQQLRLQRKRETRVEGFRNLTDSEVPLLQQHAMKLPEQGRIRIYKTFLNEFCGLLGSLTIWANNGLGEHSGKAMSKLDQSYEEKQLHVAAENLKADVKMLIWTKTSELDSIVQQRLQSKSDAAIAKAVRNIAKVVANWTGRESDGGLALRYNTYRAICRRNGSKTQSKLSRDFNEDILEPYLKKIAAYWDQGFGHSIPATLDMLVPAFAQKLKGFHIMMSSRLKQWCSPAALFNLNQQITSYEASMKQEVTGMKVKIQGEQRQANRAFVPEIQKQMVEVYEKISTEEGEGCFMRMKEHMSKHVHNKKGGIYRGATNRVMSELREIFKANREQLQMASNKIIDLLVADFQTVISCTVKIEASQVARGQINTILQKVDGQFEALSSTETSEIFDLAHALPLESNPQQSPAAGSTGVGTAVRETFEAEAMDTAL